MVMEVLFKCTFIWSSDIPATGEGMVDNDSGSGGGGGGWRSGGVYVFI